METAYRISNSFAEMLDKMIINQHYIEKVLSQISPCSKKQICDYNITTLLSTDDSIIGTIDFFDSCYWNLSDVLPISGKKYLQCLKGNTMIYVDAENARTLEKGDIFVAVPGVEHKVRNLKKGTKLLYTFFPDKGGFHV